MKLKGLIISVLSLLLVLSIIYVIGNSYDFKIEALQITTRQSTLNVSLIKPKDDDQLKGIIVIVHGDGPQNASANNAYKPMWQVMTDNGYAVVS